MGKIFNDDELDEGAERLKKVCEEEGIEGEIRIRGVALDKVNRNVKMKIRLVPTRESATVGNNRQELVKTKTINDSYCLNREIRSRRNAGRKPPG